MLAKHQHGNKLSEDSGMVFNILLPLFPLYVA